MPRPRRGRRRERRDRRLLWWLAVYAPPNVRRGQATRERYLRARSEREAWSAARDLLYRDDGALHKWHWQLVRVVRADRPPKGWIVFTYDDHSDYAKPPEQYVPFDDDYKPATFTRR